MELNLSTIKAPQPVGDYQAVVIRQNIGFVSGQFPIRDGRLVYSGRAGAELSFKQVCEAVELSAMNILSHIAKASDQFVQLDGLLRLDGYIASAEGFYKQPALLDVASNLFMQVLGDKGHHARTAFSPSQLPLNSPVELCVSFALLKK